MPVDIDLVFGEKSANKLVKYYIQNAKKTNSTYPADSQNIEFDIIKQLIMENDEMIAEIKNSRSVNIEDIEFTMSADTAEPLYAYHDTNAHLISIVNEIETYSFSISIKKDMDYIHKVSGGLMEKMFDDKKEPSPDLFSYIEKYDSMETNGFCFVHLIVFKKPAAIAATVDNSESEDEGAEIANSAFTIIEIDPYCRNIENLFYSDDSGKIRIVRDDETKNHAKISYGTVNELFLKICEHNETFTENILKEAGSDRELMRMFMKNRFCHKWNKIRATIPQDEQDWIKTLLFNEKFSDIKIFCGNNSNPLYAHKIILSNKNKYFCALFDGSIPHEITDGYHIARFPDFSMNTMKMIITLIYIGQIDPNKIKDTVEFVTAADYIGVTSITEFVLNSVLK